MRRAALFLSDRGAREEGFRAPPPFLLLAMLWTAGWLAALVAQAGADPPAEPSVPTPTVAAQRLLDEYSQRSQARQLSEALQAAEHALAAAREVPDPVGEALAQEARGRTLEELGRTAEAVAAWRLAVAAWERAGDGPGRVAALAVVERLLTADQPAEAAALFDRAVSLARMETKRPRAAAAALYAAGEACYDAGRLGPARECWAGVLAIREKVVPGSVELAETLTRLGWVALDQGDRAAARQDHQRALTILEKAAPDSLELARSVNALGNVAFQQGEPATAKQYYQRALILREKLAPDSLEVANTLTNLGNVAQRQKDFTTAREYHRRALTLREKLAPNSVDVARSLSNLADVAHDREEWATAREYCRRALDVWEKVAPNSLEMASSLNLFGDLAWHQEDWGPAGDYLRRGLALREKLAPNSLEVAGSLADLGKLARSQHDLTAAREHYQQALAIQEKLAPNSLRVASSLTDLGNVAKDQKDLPTARAYYRRALKLYEKLAPNSLEMAKSQSLLGFVAKDQGELALARQYAQRALVLREKLAPESVVLAESLLDMGNVSSDQGDLMAAQRYYQRALKLFEKLAPNSRGLAGSLTNLGIVATNLGDLAAAQEYCQRAVELFEKLAPNPLNMAASLTNLGNVAHARGDWAAAQEYYERSLALREKLAPNSSEVASSLSQLGDLARHRGELEDALVQCRRALRLRERLAPNSLGTAYSLLDLGNIAMDMEDPEAAEKYYQQTLARFKKLAPVSLALAKTLNNLGEVALRRGDLAAAEAYHRRALALQQRLAPNSRDAAYSLQRLGEVARRRGNWIEAERWTRKGWELVRRQATTITGDESRQAYGADVAAYAGSLLRAQLGRGQVSPAFLTLEAGRSQSLLQLLAERHLHLKAAPGPLQAAYQAAVTDRDRTEQVLSEAGLSQERARVAMLQAQERQIQAPLGEPARGQVDAMLKEAEWRGATRRWEQARSAYTKARLRADGLWARIQQQVPRAFLAPLSLARARRALPPGTLFAAFSVGTEPAYLFLFGAGHSGRPSLSAYPIPSGMTRLRQRVGALSEQVNDPFADPSTTVAASRTLFADLFPGPARAAVLKAKRLLISPDGPLWQVLFAALVINRQGAPRYLGLETPITYTQSLSLFAQTRADRPYRPHSGRPIALVVGDPLFDRGSRQMASAGSQELPSRSEHSLVRNGRPPAPLPATRIEAAAVARLYGDPPLLGEHATEAALRKRLAQADVIHLATHGYLDPVRAMSSGVLLAAPEGPADGESAPQSAGSPGALHGQRSARSAMKSVEPAPSRGSEATDDDGVLQAWEVFSQLKLRADLVVLSACETGRGQNVQGEGIVGLTRALQYAGARSIVASLWPVADESTARLMVAFHQRLRTGLPKDEALRQAMATVRRDAKTARPYYWAAFFLTGDPDSSTLGTRGKSLSR